MDQTHKHICHICHGKMHQAITDRTFHFQMPGNPVIQAKTITVTEFVCGDCGEIIYESTEARRIQNILMEAGWQPIHHE